MDDSLSFSYFQKLPAPSLTIFRRIPLFSAVFCRSRSSPAVLHHSQLSLTIPYQNMSLVMGLCILPNYGVLEIQ